jgi:peptidoglycan-N-acetylglucosamine deacetylase
MMARLIESMHRKGQVWFAPLEEIAAHAQRVMAEGTWTPRIDRLPYYDGPIPELGLAAPTLAR